VLFFKHDRIIRWIDLFKVSRLTRCCFRPYAFSVYCRITTVLHPFYFLYPVCLWRSVMATCFASLYLFKDRHIVMLMSCVRQCFFYMLTCFTYCRMLLYLSTDDSFIAMCLAIWLHSRRYGTVWLQPACSSFYLNIFCPFVSFEANWLARFRKRTLRATCVKPANPACCVIGVRVRF
jgi:hypothetical protein